MSAELLWDLAQERAAHALPHLSTAFWHSVRESVEKQLDKRLHRAAKDLCVFWTEQPEHGEYEMVLQLLALNAVCVQRGREPASKRYKWHMRKILDAAARDEVIAELAALL